MLPRRSTIEVLPQSMHGSFPHLFNANFYDSRGAHLGRSDHPMARIITEEEKQSIAERELSQFSSDNELELADN